MRKVTVGNNQTSWDIIMQECGSIEAFFTVVDNNPAVFTSLNTIIAPSQIVKVDDKPLNSKVKDYYSKAEHKVANAMNAAELNGGFDEGFDGGFGGSGDGGYDEGFNDGFEI